MSQSGLTIVIPCLNEERTIARAVSDGLSVLRECGVDGEVLVVDNGSRDASHRLAEEAGARVVRALRRGYGAALQAGFEEARYAYVAMVDADLSYPLKEIPRMLKALNEGHDFVLGNRLQGEIEPGAMPFLNRHLGTPVLSVLLRRLHKIPSRDCNSGLRMLRKSHVLAMELQCPGMEFATEMLVRAAQMKLKYHEFPIPFYKDQRGRKSHLNRWQDGWRHLRLLVNAKTGSYRVAASAPHRSSQAVKQRI